MPSTAPRSAAATRFSWPPTETPMTDSTRDCPCGSGRSLDDCCGRFIRGDRRPETAEALMRSRYTAFTLGDAHYLRATWHPDTRPASLEAPPGLQWLGLEIVRTEGGGEGDDQGIVEFVARSRSGGRAQRLHEVGRFLREQGRWYYVDGEILPDSRW